MSEKLAIPPTHVTVARENEVHLLDLLIVLTAHKRLVLGLPILTGACALAASLLMAPVFSSTAKIMPPQQQQSSAMNAVLGQLGGLAGAASGIAGIKNPNDVYIGLLESRTVADSLIARFNLKQRYELESMDKTRAKLAANTSVAAGKKDGFISVSITDKESQFAAKLANGYIEELTKMTQSMALTESSQRRLFFEQQLKDAKGQLATAEAALRTTQERTGMIEPDAQVKAIITNVAQIKGAVAAKEVELNAMRTFAAPGNPELLRAQEELRGLQAQLNKLEKNRPSGNGEFMLPTANIPAIGVEYIRSARDVKYYETIFELLAKQYELAKIDEAKESSLIQVLDKAIASERKVSPRRAVITLVGVFGGALLGIILAFLSAAVAGSRRDPTNHARWQRLSSAMKRG